MADIITAAELAVGDLYRPVSFGQTVRCHAYRVTAVRTIVAGDTYQLVEAVNIATGNAASISLRADITVARLELQSITDLKGYLDVMADGDQVHIVRADGKFWC